MTEIVFYCFAAVLLLAAVCVVTVRHPVHAVLSLVLCFFSSAALWVLIEAEFLAIALVLIYVGAVMVLFLFVVMMVDIRVQTEDSPRWSHLPFALMVAGTMMIETVLLLTHRYARVAGALPTLGEGNNIKTLGHLIYSHYCLPFQLAAVLLLLGMIAAISLTHRKRKNTHYLNPAQQINVKRDQRLRIVAMPAERPAAFESSLSKKKTAP